MQITDDTINDESVSIKITFHSSGVCECHLYLCVDSVHDRQRNRWSTLNTLSVPALLHYVLESMRFPSSTTV